MMLRWICLFCAICSFVAVINLPIEYYTFLRITLTLGALMVLINGWGKLSFIWIICFLFIGILFNPIFPIYFGVKIIWVPIDIITGILFLLINFKKDNHKSEEIENEVLPNATYTRDKIIKSIHTKNEKLK